MKPLVNILLISFCALIFNAASAQAPDDYIVHTIKKGEILPVLAKKYGITPEDIAKLNSFNVNHVVHVGDKVKLPANAVYRDVPDSILYPAKPPVVQAPVVAPQPEAAKQADVPAAQPKQASYVTHIIQRGEVYAVLAKKYNVSVDQILDINDFKGNHILHAGDKIKLPANATVAPAADSTKVAETHPQHPVEAKKEATGPTVPVTPVTHIIEKGERFKVLAKKYNVSVNDILRANNFPADHILHVGDKINLPANAVVTSAAPAAQQPPVPAQAQPVVQTPAADKTTVPQPGTEQTMHVVKAKETLYSISKLYKVTVTDIKNWNNLSNNSISPGQQLIIHAPDGITAPSEENKPAPQVQQPASNIPVASKPLQKAAAPPAVTSSPATKLPVQEKVSTPVAQKQEPAINPASIPATGYFSSLFGKDVSGRTLQTANGKSMTFKTASGWADKKYYILMNDVPPGSVVQITTEDGKTLYAKVLWNMGDLKDNDGLSFRISDAAAAALNLKESKFQLAVTYYE